MLRIISFLLYFSLIPSTCQAQNLSLFPFDLTQVDHRIVLPFELIEVSGMTIHNDTIWLIQDEMGVLFAINDNGKITRTLRFAGPGDFESLTQNADNLIATKSNAESYFLSKSSLNLVRRTQWPVPKDCDIESSMILEDQLILASKGNCDDDEYPGKDRLFFSCSTTSDSCSIAWMLSKSLVAEHLEVKDGYFRYLDQVIEFKKPKPSGMAKDPLSEHIYILCDSGKMLIIMNKIGAIIHIIALNSDMFRKPEGISFDPKGNLFISNEGVNGPGLIYKFNRGL